MREGYLPESRDRVRGPANHYAYRVVRSSEDGEWVDTCLEFPSLSHLDPSPGEALRGIADLVEFAVEDLEVHGEAVPGPWVSGLRLWG
ncbi:hypothetical protein [Nocardia miyunensis]|uniref:hypothetical protein n=1 Tax=Nocardia miyunensis TaxID=282684 RepID=UPI000831B6BB|nr:hypothetical protein [Nocardia miyunensis]